MKEQRGNLFELACDALCITTNGTTTTKGLAVMGAGVAKQAKLMFAGIDVTLGSKLLSEGNKVHILDYLEESALLSFPTKPRIGVRRLDPTIPITPTNDAWSIDYDTDIVENMRTKLVRAEVIPGWACTSIIEIIERSCIQLVELADSKGWNTVLLPRAGCGNGGLKWSEVKPIMAKILDDRFIVVTPHIKSGL